MKNGIDITHAETVTPIPGKNWLVMDFKSQIEACQKCLNAHNCEMDVILTNMRGEVIVQLRQLLGVAERGTALLNAESILKQYDPAITVYLQAKDDKNPLRRLRGVVINDDRS